MEVWKELRPLVTEGTQEEQVNIAVSLFINKMNQEKQLSKPADFDLKPTLIKVVSFDRVKGSKYVDKFGFSNVLKFTVEGVEHVFDISSYSFFVAVRDAKLQAGDLAMMLTFGFQDEVGGKSYRFWKFQAMESLQNREVVQAEAKTDVVMITPVGSLDDW